MKKYSFLMTLLLLSFATTASSYDKLEQGDRGDAVRELQNALIDEGYLTDEADGDFGSHTKQAVEAYQSRHGLEVTGIADDNMQTALYAGEPAQPEAEDGHALGTVPEYWWEGDWIIYQMEDIAALTRTEVYGKIHFDVYHKYSDSEAKVVLPDETDGTSSCYTYYLNPDGQIVLKSAFQIENQSGDGKDVDENENQSGDDKGTEEAEYVISDYADGIKTVILSDPNLRYYFAKYDKVTAMELQETEKRQQEEAIDDRLRGKEKEEYILTFYDESNGNVLCQELIQATPEEIEDLWDGRLPEYLVERMPEGYTYSSNAKDIIGFDYLKLYLTPSEEVKEASEE